MTEKIEQASAGVASKLNAELDTIKNAVDVKVMPTKIWCEKSMDGVMRIKVQHEGCNEFDFIQIRYDYMYTSNAHQRALAADILKLLGGQNG